MGQGQQGLTRSERAGYALLCSVVYGGSNDEAYAHFQIWGRSVSRCLVCQRFTEGSLVLHSVVRRDGTELKGPANYVIPLCPHCTRQLESGEYTFSSVAHAARKVYEKWERWVQQGVEG